MWLLHLMDTVMWLPHPTGMVIRLLHLVSRYVPVSHRSAAQAMQSCRTGRSYTPRPSCTISAVTTRSRRGRRTSRQALISQELSCRRAASMQRRPQPYSAQFSDTALLQSSRSCFPRGCTALTSSRVRATPALPPENATGRPKSATLRSASEAAVPVISVFF